MEKILNYIEDGKERFLNELIEFLKFPSVSSLSKHKPDMLACANWLVEHIKSIGIEDVRLLETEGNPAVFAQWLGQPGAPTLLIYGHYDVQPVDPVELWETDPFEPLIKNNKIIARGTADDKGQLFCHLKALESFFKLNGKPPMNIKLFFEGDEESAGEYMEDFIKDNKDLLAADYVLISDTEWLNDNSPSICYALRGIAYFEIKLTGPNRDLHSGSYGGVVDNPANVLCWLINQLKDKYGRITIPNFYDKVVPLSKEERESFKKLPFNEEEYCKDLAVDALNGEFGYSALERVWGRPALDVNGMISGFTQEGAKTVLPTEASAKFSIRLVANQSAQEIVEQVEKYIKTLTPPTMKLEFFCHSIGSPVLVSKDNPAIRACYEAMKEAFGKEPVFIREGGSIPIVENFQSILKTPPALMGLGLPGDNIHSPNENFDLNNFYGGIKASALFMDKLLKHI
ncbi:MAG: dipeptidase [Ignavibacteria bacterium]|jgi:acetylornithine deacetylase/succinyl-diaminopimelate desuccinylase-like protein|nr:dipeptidase [Ignavibacteria bacterium]